MCNNYENMCHFIQLVIVYCSFYNLSLVATAYAISVIAILVLVLYKLSH